MFDNPMNLCNLLINDVTGSNLEVGNDWTRLYKDI